MFCDFLPTAALPFLMCFELLSHPLFPFFFFLLGGQNYHRDTQMGFFSLSHSEVIAVVHGPALHSQNNTHIVFCLSPCLPELGLLLP